jgi:hypothetical protein
MDLGLSYTRVVQRVCEIMQNPAMAGQSRLVVDATGVGAPVIDLLRHAGIGGRTTAVTITSAQDAAASSRDAETLPRRPLCAELLRSGEQAHGSDERWSVPKKDLLMGLEICSKPAS